MPKLDRMKKDSIAIRKHSIEFNLSYGNFAYDDKFEMFQD